MMDNNEELSAQLSISQQLLKLCNNFKSPDRSVRKRTFSDFEWIIANQPLDDECLRNIFKETHVYFLNGLRDKSESVRSQAIKFVRFFLDEKLDVSDYYLSYIFPVLVERIGTPELVEASEEIRFELLQLLECILCSKYRDTPQLRPFLSDITLILIEAVKDKHPEMKMLGCKCIAHCTTALPRDFHLQAENLVKPVLSAFNYQRFKVRVEAIEALGLLVMHSTCKGIEQSIGPMAERLFDQVPLVRQTVAKVAAFWMREYRDRYSFFAKLLPLILTGLNDEVPETRVQAQQLWHAIGSQYEKENEADLKDQIDFQYAPPKHYPANLQRPSLGCRVLVQRHVSKIAPAIACELNSWQTDVKIRCSQLLCAIAVHAEGKLTQHMQEFLPAMYVTARDDDQRVVTNICLASYYMGCFVPAKTWCKLVMAAIEESTNYGNLMVLANLIDGCPQPYMEMTILSEIVGKLSDNFICYSRKPKYQRELIHCVAVIVKKMTNEMDNIGLHLFKIVVVVYALRDVDNVESINLELIELLRERLELAGVDAVWEKYSKDLLTTIQVNPSGWTALTFERCIFETILRECLVLYHRDHLPILHDILVQCLDVEADAEAKLQILIALAKSLDGIDQPMEDVAEFFEQLIADVLVRNLVWRAGKVAEALRTATLACVCSILTLMQRNGFNLTDFRLMFDAMLPLLLSLMEDASHRSRQFALNALVGLKQLACAHHYWQMENFTKTYPEILKRLDDPVDGIRETAIQSFKEILIDLPANFSNTTYTNHFDYILDTLFVHYDDDSLQQLQQDLILDVFKILAKADKERVAVKLKKQQTLMRNEELYATLLNCFNAIDVQ